MPHPRSPKDRWRLTGSWNTDAVTVDGYRDEGVPWPVETTRYSYLTPFGGQARDVQPGTVGLNRQALVENTELVEGDHVVITAYATGSPVPFMFRRPYEVVPLDFTRPEAFLCSVDGEAVLAPEDPELERGRLGQVRQGVRLVLNGVLGRQSATDRDAAPA